jgi:hypothetical protein
MVKRDGYEPTDEWFEQINEELGKRTLCVTKDGAVQNCFENQPMLMA